MDFKKMILIDPKTMDSIQRQQQPTLPDATTENLKELDRDMKNILEKNDLSFVDKANHYQQTLYQYLHRAGEYKNKPLGSVTIKQPPTVQPTEDGSANIKEEKEEEKGEEDIVEYVPKAYKSKAQRLLKRLKTHPNLSWNQRGEITWDGRVIPKTNLVDLVNDVLRKRKLFSPATGWETFAAALRDVNVPREIVGNPDRWRYITQTPKQSDWTRLYRGVRPHHHQQQQPRRLTELEEKQRGRRERLSESIKKHKQQMNRSQEQTGVKRKLTWESW